MFLYFSILILLFIFIALFYKFYNFKKLSNKTFAKEEFIEKRHTDSLTTLHTRNYFMQTTEALIQNQHHFTLFSIDLNKFKVINDLKGHYIGDIILKEIGSRLKFLENKDLFFARIGGDEFMAILKNTTNEQIQQTSVQIQSTITKIIVHDNFEYQITASIGIVKFPEHAKNLSDLLNLADFAMYYAKKNELKEHYLVTKEFQKKISDRQSIKDILKDLDVEKDLELRFQPLFHLSSGKLFGVESIVNWKHINDVFQKEKFLSVAEELGNIQDIVGWIFLTSMHYTKKINEKSKNKIRMNIKVSQVCIHHKIFFGNLTDAIINLDIKPSCLGIEFNEYSVTYAPKDTKNSIKRIDKLGTEIIISDFGVGQICISDIKKFYTKYIKISPKLIQKIDKEKDTLETVQGIINLAKGMNIKIIADGVENETQLNLLKELNCDIVQGNFLSTSLTAIEFEKKYL